MRRHAIIYNPAAGQGRAAERLEDVKAALDEAAIQYEIHLTERPGHAAELAAAAVKDSFDVVVAAGGDGTVNEVINGLMRSTGDGAGSSDRRPSFGVICVGRGNDFAYGAGIPTEADESIEVLRAGHEKPLDVGYLQGGDYPDGRYFGNGIGVGFDTIVGLEAAKMKRIHGFAAYLVAAFKTLLFYYKTPRLRIEVDSETTTRECVQFSLMNGQRLGGAFFMAPAASTGDGSFNLCVAGKPKRRQMLGLLLRYMKGTQEESRHITTGLAKSVSLTAEEGTMAVHADGETMCTEGTELEVQCVPSALRIVTRAGEAVAE